MKKFAKIFDSGENQVLVTTNYNDDEDSYYLIIRTDVDGTCCEVKAGFHDEDDCEHAFDTYDQETADQFVKGMVEMFNEEL